MDWKDFLILGIGLVLVVVAAVSVEGDRNDGFSVL